MDERLIRRVGAISMVVIGLSIGFVVFVSGRIEWGSHVRVRVYFHQTGGLRQGAPFVVAGRAVGKVETIALSPRSAPGPLAGDEGIVVTVAIDAREAGRLERGGDVFVASRGALSDKYLELGPAPAPGPTLHEGDELVGSDPPSLDRVMQRTWDNLITLGTFATEVRPELDTLRGELDRLRAQFDPRATSVALPAADRLGPLVDDAEVVASEIRRLRDVGLGGDAGLARIQTVLADADATIAATRTMLDRLGAHAASLGASVEGLRGRLGTKGDEALAAVERAIDRVRAAIDKVDPLLAQIEALNATIAAGDGSLLKLMHDPEFPEDAKELGKIIKRHPWRLLARPF